MTYLSTQVLGRRFFLYLILDRHGHEIFGRDVHASDDAEQATHLAKRAALTEGVHAMADDARCDIHAL